MVSRFTSLISAVSAVAVAAVVAFAADGAAAQSREPIKIGFSMAMTGGLAANGKSALLAHEDLGGGRQRQGRAARAPGQARLLRRPEQSGDGAGHLHEAARRRQGRPRDRPLCDRADRAGDADRDAAQQGLHRAARARRQQRVPLPELLRDDPVGAGSASRAFTKGFFDIAMAQTPKPQTRRDRRRRPGVLAQRLRRRARERQDGRVSRSSTTRAIRPSTTDFAPIVRAIQATNPDLVVLCSYPPDSVGHGARRSTRSASSRR